VFKLTARARLLYDDCISDNSNKNARNLFFSFFKQLAVVTRRSLQRKKMRDLFFLPRMVKKKRARTTRSEMTTKSVGAKIK